VTVKTAAPAKPAREKTGTRKAAECYFGALVVVALLALAMHSVIVLALGVLMVIAAAVLHARLTHRRRRQGGKAAARQRAKHQGWATWWEIHRKLSPTAVRRKGRRLYPAVRRAQAAVIIGRTKGTGPVTGRIIAGTWADTYLLLAPPQTLKSALLSGWAADAPGALLATSSRGDLWRNTALDRERLGQVRVLDVSGTPGIPSNFAWNPVTGCEDTDTATRRAADLMAASPRDPGGRDAWIEDRAGRLLRYMLHTAAVVGGNMHDVRDWIQGALTGQPLTVMAASGDPRWAKALEALLISSGEHLGSVVSSAEAALGWMDNKAMAAAACPDPGQGIDVAKFVAGAEDSVVLISEDRDQASPAPFFAAFTAEVFYQARAHAERSGGRLPIPLTLALDELPTIVPVPFHKWSSVAAGYNICLIGCVQSPSQLPERWGEKNAETIWNNSKIKVVGGGFTLPKDLEDLSALCGDVDIWHDGTHESRRLASPERIRLLDADKFQALVIHRNTRPVEVTITPVWARPGYQAATLTVPQMPAQQPAITVAPARAAIAARMARRIPTPVLTRPAPRALPARLAIEPPSRAAIPMPGAPASIPGHLRRPVTQLDPVPALTGTTTHEEDPWPARSV